MLLAKGYLPITRLTVKDNIWPHGVAAAQAVCDLAPLWEVNTAASRVRQGHLLCASQMFNDLWRTHFRTVLSQRILKRLGDSQNFHSGVS